MQNYSIKHNKHTTQKPIGITIAITLNLKNNKLFQQNPQITNKLNKKIN